jgi:hypothetical protein
VVSPAWMAHRRYRPRSKTTKLPRFPSTHVRASAKAGRHREHQPSGGLMRPVRCTTVLRAAHRRTGFAEAISNRDHRCQDAQGLDRLCHLRRGEIVEAQPAGALRPRKTGRDQFLLMPRCNRGCDPGAFGMVARRTARPVEHAGQHRRPSPGRRTSHRRQLCRRPRSVPSRPYLPPRCFDQQRIVAVTHEPCLIARTRPSTLDIS